MPLLDTLIDLICYPYPPDQAAIIAEWRAGVRKKEGKEPIQKEWRECEESEAERMEKVRRVMQQRESTKK